MMPASPPTPAEPVPASIEPPVERVPEARPASTRELLISGSAWTIIGYGTAIAFRMGSNLILAYLLFPAAFGLMALLQVFLVGLQMFSDVGLGPGVVRSHRGDDRAFLDTTFTIGAVRGLVLWVCLVLIAYPAGVIYHPDLVLLLPIGGTTVIFQGLACTALFTANRRLNVRTLVLMDMGTQCLGIVITVVWAWLMPTVWSLVGGSIVTAILRTAMSHVVLGRSEDRFRFERDAAREQLHFGKWIFVSTAVTFIAMNVDRMLLGVLVPIGVLGVYNIASSLARMPQDLGEKLSSTLLYPALANWSRQDPSLLGQKVLRVRGLIIPLCFVICLGVALGSPAFFEALYDQRYAAATWMAPLISISAWFALLRATAERALLAAGDTKTLAMSNFLGAAVTAGGSLAGNYFWGVPGFILGLAAGAGVSALVVDLGLARRGVLIVKADLAYTALFLVVLALGERVPHWTGPLPRWQDVALRVGVTAAVCIPFGVWSLVRLRRGLVPA